MNKYSQDFYLYKKETHRCIYTPTTHTFSTEARNDHNIFAPLTNFRYNWSNVFVPFMNNGHGLRRSTGRIG